MNVDTGYDYKTCIGLKVKPRQGDGLVFYSLLPNGTIDKVIFLFHLLLYACNCYSFYSTYEQRYMGYTFLFSIRGNKIYRSYITLRCSTRPWNKFHNMYDTGKASHLYGKLLKSWDYNAPFESENTNRHFFFLFFMNKVICSIC